MVKIQDLRFILWITFLKQAQMRLNVDNITLTYYVICYIIKTVEKEINELSGQAKKGENMEEGMTDKQFNKVLKMILLILEGCKDIEEAEEKIKDLLK